MSSRCQISFGAHKCKDLQQWQLSDNASSKRLSNFKSARKRNLSWTSNSTSSYNNNYNDNNYNDYNYNTNHDNNNNTNYNNNYNNDNNYSYCKAILLLYFRSSMLKNGSTISQFWAILNTFVSELSTETDQPKNNQAYFY